MTPNFQFGGTQGIEKEVISIPVSVIVSVLVKFYCILFYYLLLYISKKIEIGWNGSTAKYCERKMEVQYYMKLKICHNMCIKYLYMNLLEKQFIYHSLSTAQDQLQIIPRA